MNRKFTTNQGKAVDIAQHILETYPVINKDNLPNALWFAAVEMSEWKDEQFKNKIEELFNDLEKAGYNDRVKSGFEIFKNKIDEELLKAMEE